MPHFLNDYDLMAPDIESVLLAEVNAASVERDPLYHDMDEALTPDLREKVQVFLQANQRREALVAARIVCKKLRVGHQAKTARLAHLEQVASGAVPSREYLTLLKDATERARNAEERLLSLRQEHEALRQKVTRRVSDSEAISHLNAQIVSLNAAAKRLENDRMNALEGQKTLKRDLLLALDGQHPQQLGVVPVPAASFGVEALARHVERFVQEQGPQHMWDLARVSGAAQPLMEQAYLYLRATGRLDVRDGWAYPPEGA